MEYVLGIDLGATNLKAALVDKDGKTKGFQSIPTQKGNGPQPVLDQILDLIFGFKNKLEEKDHLIGVGLALPGSVDVDSGVCLYSPNLGWKNEEVSKKLQECTELGVKLINDANAACLGEYFFGAGKGRGNLICITIGTGIGTAFILENKLFVGASGFAGEGGHMVINPFGPHCSCGRRGCWEALVSASGIVARAKKEIESQNLKTNLERYKDSLSTEIIVEAARQGDRLALKVLEETREYLAIGLVNLVNIFNPEQIVLAGGVIGAKDILFNGLEKLVKKAVFPGFCPELE
ncbi:MAG TPA: ROK family protein, partial [Clostridia bacterium]|nr:ROK family protein [Clostridia bacterium]